MSDYRLDFESIVSPGDTERLYSLLSIVSEGDELVITIEDDDQEQADAIIDVLQNNNFNVSTGSGKNGKGYHITAKRMA